MNTTNWLWIALAIAAVYFLYTMGQNTPSSQAAAPVGNATSAIGDMGYYGDGYYGQYGGYNNRRRYYDY